MFNKHSTTKLSGAEDGFASVVHEVERGGRISILAGVTSQVIRLGLQIMFGRVLGAQTFGIYTLGRSVLEVATHFSLVGMHNGVVYFLPIFREEGDDARVKGTILYAIALVGGMSSFIALCLWLAAGLLSERVFKEPNLVHVLRGFAISLPFYALLLLLASCARGFRHMTYYRGITDIIHPLGLFVLVAGAFWLGMKLEGVIWGFIISTGLSLLLMVRFMLHLFPQALSLEFGCRFEGKRIFLYAMRVFLTDFSRQLLRHTDRFMLGYVGAAHEVGIYSMSAFMGDKIVFFQTMFNGIFAPVISVLYSKGRERDVSRIFKTVAKWTLLLTLPIFFTFIFLGRIVLGIFGHEFQEGWPILVVLAVADLIGISVGPVGNMLVMTGRPGLELTNVWISGVMNILLNLWLIPRYGALGAALATGISLTTLNLVRLVQVYLVHQCHPFRIGTLKVLTAFALAGGAVWQLDRLYRFEGWWLLAALGFFMLGYFGLLAVFGWDEEDQLVLNHLWHKIHGWLFGSRRQSSSRIKKFD